MTRFVVDTNPVHRTFFIEDRVEDCTVEGVGSAVNLHGFWMTVDPDEALDYANALNAAIEQGEAVNAKRIRITGSAAREIASHVAIYVKPTRNWSEVKGMGECEHGCCLYVRKQGAVTQYRLMHNSTYGCALGRSADTRDVPVSVAPMAKA